MKQCILSGKNPCEIVYIFCVLQSSWQILPVSHHRTDLLLQVYHSSAVKEGENWEINSNCIFQQNKVLITQKNVNVQSISVLISVTSLEVSAHSSVLSGLVPIEIVVDHDTAVGEVIFWHHWESAKVAVAHNVLSVLDGCGSDRDQDLRVIDWCWQYRDC